MAIEQTLLFTVIPRGVTIGGTTAPISVFVSPRLRGESKLGPFSDWRHWTTRLHDHGLSIELLCGGRSQVVAVDAGVLRPDLWEALFSDDTLVHSHVFNDYSDRGIISYPVRRALSALKSIYQQASVSLAIPQPPGGRDEGGLRGVLTDLVDGLDVHWSPRQGEAWREQTRITRQTAERGSVFARASAAQLDSEGLIVGSPDPNVNRATSQRFAVFHHMPLPPRDELKPDWKTALDFHQALSALNGYPLLQRAMGLVFDFDVPLDFIAPTPSGPGTILVGKVSAHWPWAITPTIPPLATAYLNLDLGGGNRLFLTAPRAIVDSSAPTQVIGLLNLDPADFGLAQVDVDGGMHKTIILADTLVNQDPATNRFPTRPEAAPHPEVFDPEATLPALRSGAFTLYADGRAVALLDTFAQSKAFNDAVEKGGAQPRPFFAEDLVRGYRLDVWDSHTAKWHSLHQRTGTYKIGEIVFGPKDDEGFVQLAATQPAKGAQPASDDLYLHEAVARWAGWSLSAGRPGKHLSRYADPAKAIPPDHDDPDYRENEPVTPFKMKVDYKVVPKSLPELRFGRRYRMRARVVDLAGNSLAFGATADQLASFMALPQDPEGFAYLRYEPVIAPLVVIRDPAAVTGPGSAVDRIVIRTFNDDPSNDQAPADTSAGDRHILPPRASVELGEHLGMFDDATGKLKGDAATWNLIGTRDGGELPKATIVVAGKSDDYPLVAGDRIDTLPYLPDPLARGAAMRDLPGTQSGTRGRVAPGAGAPGPVTYAPLGDSNPRPGSATLVGFGTAGDWTTTVGFRLALAEPQPGEIKPPQWDPANRVLTVFLAKGTTATLPLTSYLNPDDLKLMGQWQWLRQFIERITVTEPRPQFLQPGQDMDRIAHVLQRAVEGGHWMLNPPRLLTLVHAVQQPLGRPEFAPLDVTHVGSASITDPLQTAPVLGRRDPTELAPITGWRRPGANEAYLIGALRVHGASTAKVDLQASWDEPIDDLTQSKWALVHRQEHVDELPLPQLAEGYLIASGAGSRRVGYYDPEHDQIGFVRAGDTLGVPGPNQQTLVDAAPRHFFNDTRHRRVAYVAIATSRYREYFDQDHTPPLSFARASDPVTVDVPASSRPLAPAVVYVIPTFGWQRQTDTNLKRSVRFGGGLRVYFERPWFSSGEGELLGVALWSYANGPLDRDKFKPFITQWGMDPVWSTQLLSGIPGTFNLSGGSQQESAVSLEEATARNAVGAPGRIDVVGFEPEFDEERGLWFADLTINTFGETYMPFVRLALVRYQPHALADAKVSHVVLADFAQLTPDRSAMVTADPHHPRTLRIVVSGVAPQGPKPIVRAEPLPRDLSTRPTRIRLRVQERDAALQSDLGWSDAPAAVAAVAINVDGTAPGQPDLELFAATVTFAAPPSPGQFRLLIEEHEYPSADYVLVDGDRVNQPGRLIYAEIFAIDDALVRE
jgi:hypothetical protein